jgi:hypothetical protein
MWWKIYFWGYALLLITTYYFLYFKGRPKVWDYLDSPLSVIAMVGVFGFAYEIKLFTPQFWKLWLIVIIGWDLIYNILITKILGEAQQIEIEEEGSPSWLATITNWVFIFPQYVALYLYSNRSPNIWVQDPAN